MISKTGIHATLALALLAKLGRDEYAGAAQIAKEVGAPRNYLGKLLKQLAERGLLVSQKGFGGGFRLARPADKITLFDIIEPLDRVSKWNGCFLGRAKCSDKSPCAVHHRWSRIRDGYLDFLKETTIAEVATNKVAIL
ncbi:MAG: Rrf2 family transcriptional regulator [bacterium]